MGVCVSTCQVARTITNLQQQIQQHQRQLAQALLVKQPPPPPPPPHLSLHPSAGKSGMESFPPPPQAPGLPDLQTKEQQSSPNTFAPYPLGESSVGFRGTAGDGASPVLTKKLRHRWSGQCGNSCQRRSQRLCPEGTALPSLQHSTSFISTTDIPSTWEALHGGSPLYLRHLRGRGSSEVA